MYTNSFPVASLADTWSWTGTTWTQLTPAHSPPGRAYGSMAYDPRKSNALLFGGLGTLTDQNFNGTPRSDTWAFGHP